MKVKVPWEYRLTQRPDNSFSTVVLQCTVLYYTLLQNSSLLCTQTIFNLEMRMGGHYISAPLYSVIK